LKLQDPPPERGFERPQPPPMMSDPVQGPDPMRQLRALVRYKWQILAVTLLCVLVVAFAVFSITPDYRGTATVLVEPNATNVVQIQEVYEPGAMTPISEYQNTQIEVLKSRMIAERVFTDLELAKEAEYAEKPPAFVVPDFLSDAIELLRQTRPEAAPRAGPDAQIARLRSRIRVELVPKTNLVKVHVEAEDPALSAKVANGVVDAFLQYERGTRGGITEQATGWLNQRLAEIRTDLEKAEKNLQAFYDSEQLVNVGGARGMVEEEITDNARRLREARKVKTDLENVYRRIVEAGNSIEKLQEIPVIQQQSLVEATKKSFLVAQEEMGGLQSRYGSNHPKMVAVRARLEESRDAYHRQVRVAAEGIRSQYEIARNTEQSLAVIVQGSKSQIQGLDRKQNQIQMLQREVDSNRKLYETFLERAKETDITGNMDVSKVRLIERAVVPQTPYKPRKKLWVATALLMGLFLGVSLALLRAYLDDTVKTPLDLEQIAGVPALTVLPIVRRTGKRGERLARMELDEPGSVFSEGIRTLRTSIMLADVSGKRARILVTSAIPAEGKTSVALNLALALGQMERVLLVDADLRKPTIGLKLKLPANAKGVTDILAGTAELKDCIAKDPQGHIDVLPCGTLPPNPQELLGSARFAALLKELSARYDRVVIDSAPCHPVSDALLLGRLTDAVVFLVKADATPSRLVSASVRKLRQAGAPIVGAVLNQANMRRQSGFAYGYYYYEGGYGSYKATS